MKKMLAALLIACLTCTALAACSDKTPPEDSSAQVVNPIEPVTSLDALTEKVSFPVTMPQYPGEVIVHEYLAIDGTVAEIRYNLESDVITFRMARGRDNISGVYTVYSDEEEFTIGDFLFTVQCEEGDGYLLLWTLNDMTYSLFSEAGMPVDTFKRMVESIL